MEFGLLFYFQDKQENSPIIIYVVIVAVAVMALFAIGMYLWKSPLDKVSRRKVSTAISTAKFGIEFPEWISIWVNTLSQADLLDAVFASQNTVIYGDNSQGRQAIMLLAFEEINKHFETTRDVAIYLDIGALAQESTVHSLISIEDLYRKIVLSPLVWYEHILDSQQISYRAFPLFFKRMERSLYKPSTEMDYQVIGDAFKKWLNQEEIENIHLLLDNFSALPNTIAPTVLQMLKNSFPRGSQVILKVAGSKKSTHLETIAMEGHIGLQIHHDIVVGLNLDDLLKTPNLESLVTDPRQAFLVEIMRTHAPQLISEVENPATVTLFWGSLFQEETLWFDVFKLGKFDISRAGDIFEDLTIEALSNPNAKISYEMIQHASARVNVKIDQIG